MPSRRCVGCGLHADVRNLVRMVVVEGSLQVDLKRQKGGRGAHCCPRIGCVARAIERGGFQRTLRVSVTPFDPVAFSQGMLTEMRRSYAQLEKGAERGGVAPEWGPRVESLRQLIEALEVDEDAGWVIPSGGRRKRRKKGSNQKRVL